MTVSLSKLRQNRTHAYVVPFAAFMVCNLLIQLLADGAGVRWEHPDAPWWREWPEQWLYPIQCLIVGSLLGFYWKHYSFKPVKGMGLAVVAGVLGIGIWLLPTTLYDHLGFTEDSVGLWSYFGVEARQDGFDPAVLEPEFGTVGYWISALLRFFRAVVIVALVEEIFWRGFLMRFLLKPDGDYWKEPFGVAHWKSYVVVTGCFMLIHQSVDYFGAFFFGSIMYALCVRTKSLLACVVMHGLANLLMGLYALHFHKFGLW